MKTITWHCDRCKKELGKRPVGEWQFWQGLTSVGTQMSLNWKGDFCDPCLSIFISKFLENLWKHIPNKYYNTQRTVKRITQPKPKPVGQHYLCIETNL